MTHKALTIIRAEHDALAAMLRSLQMLVARAASDGTHPDFAVLRAMLLYVDEFPERLHHAKESGLLFPRLRARTPKAAQVLERLDAEHHRGEHAIRDLEHDLLAWEVLGEPRRAAFAASLERYVGFYLEHMRLEETEVLPLAQQSLTDDDWAELDRAFAANRDPLTGHEPSDEYRDLFRRIVMTAPAPIGVGPVETQTQA